MYFFKEVFLCLFLNTILLIWMIKRLSYDIHDITQRLTLLFQMSGAGFAVRGLRRQMCRFVCREPQLIISFMLFWLLVSLRDNHCEVLRHLVDISGEEHMVDSKEQTPLSSSAAGYGTARGGGSGHESCRDTTAQRWMPTPRRRVRAFLHSEKLDAAQKIFPDSAFCLVFQNTSKHPLKPDRFTLDAKLHVMFIHVYFYDPPVGKAFVSIKQAELSKLHFSS